MPPGGTGGLNRGSVRSYGVRVTLLEGTIQEYRFLDNYTHNSYTAHMCKRFPYVNIVDFDISVRYLNQSQLKHLVQCFPYHLAVLR